MKRRSCLAIFAASASMAVASNCCFGQFSTWNTGTGFWNVPSNWLPAAVPPAGNEARIFHSDAVLRNVTFNFNYTSPLDNITINQTGTGASTLLIGANQLLAGSITLADTGRGVISQSGGTVGITGVVRVGGTSTSAGTYLMGGGTLGVGSLQVGSAGFGSFIQSAGSVNLTGSTGLLVASSGRGFYGLSGAGFLDVDHSELIADFGNGTFNQSGGTHNVAGTLTMAGSSNSAGTYLMSGGTLTVSNDLIVGTHSTGRIIQTGGVVKLNHDLLLGSDQGFSFGHYSVDNTGSLTVSHDVLVASGSGSFQQLGGATRIGHSMHLGYAGGFGQLLVSGGTFTTLSNISLGPAGDFPFDETDSAGGLVSQTGGSVDCFILSVSSGASHASTGTYNLSGGTLTASSTIVGDPDPFGQQGTFNQTGGLLTTSGISVGSNSGKQSTFTLSAGTIGAGEMAIRSDGTIPGAFTQTGGVANIVGFNGMNVGVGSLGGTGTATLSGGSLTVSTNIIVGAVNASGTLTQQGTMAVSASTILLGASPNSNGTYAIFNSASLSVANGVQVGSAPSSNSASGAGTFICNGGSVSVGSFDVTSAGTLLINTTTPLAAGSIALNGTMIVNSVASSARVNDIAMGPDGRIILNFSTLSTSGAITNLYGARISGPGTLNLLPGARFTGWGIVDSRVLNAGTITASSGDLLFNAATFTNNGTLAVAPGAGMFVNASVLTHTGDISVGPGGSMVFTQPLTIPTGHVAALSGGLLSTPSLTNSAGATVSGFGQINGDVTNSGSISLIASSQLIGNLTNNAGGQIAVRNDRVIVTGSGANSGTITTSNGTIIFDGGLNSTVGGGGTTSITQSGGLLASFVRQNALSITGSIAQPGNATIRSSSLGGDTSVVQQLALGGSNGAWTGRFDLDDTDLIIDYAAASPRATVEDQVRTARHGGTWDGNGITSAAAKAQTNHATTLGVLESSAYQSIYGAGATFSGQSTDPTMVLVKYTWYGDSDFNGRVNFDDYVRIDNGFNNHLSGWLNGDFDLSGQVNFDDYVLIDLAFNVQSGTLRRALAFADGSDRTPEGMDAPSLLRVRTHFEQFGDSYLRGMLAAVPEPTSLSIVVMCLLVIPLGVRRTAARGHRTSSGRRR